MMQTQTQTESLPRAVDLEADFRRQGFQPGYPPHIAPVTRAVDQSSARKRRCPSCSLRMGGVKAFHKPGRYKVLAICPCGCGEEV